MRGHDILQKSREFIEAQGYQVIYGDTDSVFVHVYGHQAPDRLGTELANALNLWWRDTIQKEFNLECHLEMEFEIHYEKFVMPTIRGSETGSKKRYAGWTRVENESLMVFKGLEAVRSDWTPLAKRFQTQLYEKHFRREDYKAFIVKTVQDLQNGLLDEQLVYSRRLRRKIEQYEKQAPPQVQAARLKQQINPHWQGRNIEYVKTTQGWQPIPFASAPFDYQHYITKQLEPIADALLHFFGESFAELIDEQLSLF